MAQRPSPAPNAATQPEHAPATPPPRTLSQGIVVASYLLMAAALLLVMWRGLLPGLLCVCLGFLLTRALTGWFAQGLARLQRQNTASARSLRAAQIAAAALVMLLPLALLAAGLTHSRGYLVTAPQQYQELLNYMARTVLELRLKLPVDVASHLPEGAVPKDGPSAGIGMVTSIVSTLTGIAVHKDVAMTGEVTLRGRVLPIGGLKEKLLAALRGGIKTVLIPQENAKDLAEIPANIKEGLEIVPVSHVDEVLERALIAPLVAIDWSEDDDLAAKPAAGHGGDGDAALRH